MFCLCIGELFRKTQSFEGKQLLGILLKYIILGLFFFYLFYKGLDRVMRILRMFAPEDTHKRKSKREGMQVVYVSEEEKRNRERSRKSQNVGEYIAYEESKSDQKPLND